MFVTRHASSEPPLRYISSRFAMPLVDPISMSSASAQSPTGQSSESKPKYLIHPAPVADSPIAKGIAFSRPAILLVLLATGLSWLIAEPSSALQLSAPIVTVIQLAYATLSLPVAGSQLAKARKGQKKRESGGSSISTAILSLILTTISTPVVYAFFVLFGAPFLDNTFNTILCAFHFSLLGLFPVFFVRGLDNQALVAVAGAAAPIDETFGALGGAILGAWLGAIPIPLDWDRDWQKWPVTIVIGMYLGSCLGSWVGGTILYGKRLGSDSAVATTPPTKQE